MNILLNFGQKMTPGMLVFASIQTKNELFDEILMNFGPKMFTLSIYIYAIHLFWHSTSHRTDGRKPQWAKERILNNALLRNAKTNRHKKQNTFHIFHCLTRILLEILFFATFENISSFDSFARYSFIPKTHPSTHLHAI